MGQSYSNSKSSLILLLCGRRHLERDVELAVTTNARAVGAVETGAEALEKMRTNWTIERDAWHLNSAWTCLSA